MPHKHDDEYLHRHDFGIEPHVHRLVEVIEHAHGAHGGDRHKHTHIIMTAAAEGAAGDSHHRHRLSRPFEHEHPSEQPRHRHEIGDLEHHDPDRHWHAVEITEIELTWTR